MQVQRQFNEELGEDKFVLMMVSLHIEFVIEAMLGKTGHGSGFVEIINKAAVLIPGRAESIVSGSDNHMKLVCYTHQVFLAACMILCEEAFEKTPS